MELPAETKVITTPAREEKVMVRAYITGKQLREYRQFLFNLANKEGGMQQGDYDAAEDCMIRLVVLSVGEKTENVNELVTDMHKKDYEFILNEVRQTILGTDSDGNETVESKKKEQS